MSPDTDDYLTANHQVRPRLKNEDVTVRKVADNRFAIGSASAITMAFGIRVRVYDLERTICDLFRSRSTVIRKICNPPSRIT